MICYNNILTEPGQNGSPIQIWPKYDMNEYFYGGNIIIGVHNDKLG